MSLVAIAGVPIAGIQNYGGARVLAAARRPERLTREILRWSGFSICVSASFASLLWFCGDDAARAIFGTRLRPGWIDRDAACPEFCCYVGGVSILQGPVPAYVLRTTTCSSTWLHCWLC